MHGITLLLAGGAPAHQYLTLPTRDKQIGRSVGQQLRVPRLRLRKPI
jgi:hypothetical protein